MCYKNGRAPSERVEKGSLTVGEIARATRKIVRTFTKFPKELAMLQRFPREPTSSVVAMPIEKKLYCMGNVSPLRKLSPLLLDVLFVLGVARIKCHYD